MGICCSKDGGGSRGRANSDLSLGRLSEGRRVTLAPNMKNFKNLRYVDDIKQLYEIGSELGKGSFGSVNKCTRKGADRDTQFAIKTILKKSLKANPMLPSLMMNELSILQKVSHPNIMTAKELLEDDHHFYIITEILEGGELFDRLIKLKNFSEKNAATIVKQIILALNYMHKQKMTHRDLKPENVLLESDVDDNLNLKIADFGFSCVFDPKEGLDLVLGSPLYMAPELILR